MHSSIIDWLNSADWKLWWFLVYIAISAVIAWAINKLLKEDNNIIILTGCVMNILFVLVFVAAFLEVVIRAVFHLY